MTNPGFSAEKAMMALAAVMVDGAEAVSWNTAMRSPWALLTLCPPRTINKFDSYLWSGLHLTL